MKKKSRLFIDVFVISLISFLSLEVLLQFLLRSEILELHGVLKHQSISKKEFDRYLKLRDDDLGWPSELAHGQLFNEFGYRPTPESLKYKSQKACIAVFGDSQGYALDVSDSEAWTNVLSRRLGCKVENYSVPAYGTDQAYLRFKKVEPNADTIIMTFIDDNLRRNFLQFWDLQYGEIYLDRTKPRFFLDDNGNLNLVPLPVNTYKDLKDINNWKFEKVFKHETFVPNSKEYKTAHQLPRFSYVASLGNSIIKSYITKYNKQNNLSNPILINFIDRRKIFDPTTNESITLQKAILQDFVKTCSIKYKNCLILRLSMNFPEPENEYKNPIPTSLEKNLSINENFIKGGYMAKCMKKNLLEQGLSKGNLDIKAPGGHYGPETNKAIADCLYKKLSK